MMNKRWQDILNILKTNSVATSEAMAAQLNVSSKTIQNDLRKMNSDFNGKGAYIQSKQSVGYALVIEDIDKFNHYLKNVTRQLTQLPTTADERVDYILQLLLINSDSYIKIDDLAEQLYISKSSISSDLKDVRKVLAGFNLTVISRPNYGIKIRGTEFDLRLCSAYYSVKSIAPEGEKSSIEIIHSCVSSHLNDSDIKISHSVFRNLIVHIYVAIVRIKGGHYVSVDPIQLDAIKETPEYALSKDIIKSLEVQLDLAIPEVEHGYLAIHLLGKRFLEYTPGDDNLVISNEISDLVKCMLNEVKNSYNYDFADNFELTMNLSLHLIPLDTRMQYDINLKNPLLDDIKKQYPLAYMLAVSASNILEVHYGKPISADEVAYFALHFNLALLHDQSEKVMKKNILIVCSTGRGSASILVHKFRKEVGRYLNRIETCDVLNLENYDFENIDYVISTVSIPFKIPIPILEVQFFLDNNDIRAIENLLTGNREFTLKEYFDERLFLPNIKGKTKEDIIQTMVNEIHQVKNIPDNFYDLVMKREAMAFTEFGNLVAIPHPSEPLGDETFVCIAILEKPIIWDKMEVQFILMMSLKEVRDEKMDDFSTAISRFLLDSRYVKTMIETKEYKTLAACFNEIEIEMRDE